MNRLEKQLRLLLMIKETSISCVTERGITHKGCCRAAGKQEPNVTIHWRACSTSATPFFLFYFIYFLASTARRNPKPLKPYTTKLGKKNSAISRGPSVSPQAPPESEPWIWEHNLRSFKWRKKSWSDVREAEGTVVSAGGLNPKPWPLAGCQCGSFSVWSSKDGSYDRVLNRKKQPQNHFFLLLGGRANCSGARSSNEWHRNRIIHFVLSSVISSIINKIYP